jgi:hypothetical protein
MLSKEMKALNCRDQKGNRNIYTDNKSFNPGESKKRLLMQVQDQTKLGFVQSKSDLFCHRIIIVQYGLIDVPTLSGQQSTPIVRSWTPASISILPVTCFNGLKQFHSRWMLKA